MFSFYIKKNSLGSGIIQVESQTLERLLEALDSRHIAGWYQPAMRLQAYIHHLDGVNKTLREELHIFRCLYLFSHNGINFLIVPKNSKMILDKEKENYYMSCTKLIKKWKKHKNHPRILKSYLPL